MKTKLREKAINLRLKKRFSYGQIRKIVPVAKSTLSYWLRELPLSEREIHNLRVQNGKLDNAGREKFRATMQKKRETDFIKVYSKYKKGLANLSKDAFLVAGLMLYLGEGDKKNRNKIALVNTDIRVIKFFVKWLIEYLNVSIENIRVELQLYENMNIEREMIFWQKGLKISRKQFYKPYIHKLRKSSFSYRESYRHGTCGIHLPGTERKTTLMAMLQAFLDNYMRE